MAKPRPNAVRVQLDADTQNTPLNPASTPVPATPDVEDDATPTLDLDADDEITDLSDPEGRDAHDLLLDDDDVTVPTPFKSVHDGICARCGDELHGTSVPDPDANDDRVHICLHCGLKAKGLVPTEEEYQRREEARRAYLLDNYSFHLRNTLDNWRVPKGRTRDCTKKGVPPELWGIIPDHVLTAMRAGSLSMLNGVGYGLIGATGVGKTGLQAVLVKGYNGVRFKDWVEHNPLHHEPNLPPENVYWLNWPEVADDLSRMGTDARGLESFQSRARRATLVVLDDLGRERFAARNDEAATPLHQAQLERLIDARNEMRKPIFWTSNLGMKDLLALYGSAFMSRLVQSNPPIEVPAGLPNQRLL
jgi:DNA replication protein DnaC